jgi:hypothetical protein
MDSVARESTTPMVIEPAIRTIVTIAQVIGTIRNVHQRFAGYAVCYSVNFTVCRDDSHMR